MALHHPQCPLVKPGNIHRMRKVSISPRAPGGFFCASPRVLTFPSPPHSNPPAPPGTLLTVHIELDGSLLATWDGLIHATAGEDAPDVQVCGVNEQLADGGLPLPILQQFLGWDKGGRVVGDMVKLISR